MATKKTWAVFHTYLFDMCLSRNQTAKQIMMTIQWSRLKEEKDYWKEEAEKFLKTSKPGDIFAIKDYAYLVRERPHG